MRKFTSSLFALALLSSIDSTAQEKMTLNWDIYAEKMPSTMTVELMNDGQVVQSIDIAGSNALEIDVPTESFVILTVKTPIHRDRTVYIDTHHALADRKEAKQNKKFVYDLYLVGKNEALDDAHSYMLRSVSFEEGSSRILFDELLTELEE